LIRDLPLNITSCSNLSYISFDNNKFKEIPELIAQLENLKKISLKENRITKIQNSVVELENLEHLFVEGNPIENLPHFINSSSKVEDINRYIKKSVAVEEILLEKMMNYVSLNCSINKFNVFVKKIKVDEEKTKEVVADKTLMEHEQILKLLKIWRE